MGARQNKSFQDEDQGTITLSKDGIISFLKNKLSQFKKKSQIIDNARLFMDENINNNINEDTKWTNHKDNKYTEKQMEIFSGRITCISDEDKFKLDYFYYIAYYIEYANFEYVNERGEKGFRDIVQTIDANFEGRKKGKNFQGDEVLDINYEQTDV